MLYTFIFGYSVFRLLEYAQEPADKEKKQQQWEDFKKKRGFASETSAHSDHWKEAHDKIQKSTGSVVVANVESPDSSSDLIATRTLPIWFRKRQDGPYTESDPEFQEFVRFQSDKKKVDDVTRQVLDKAKEKLKCAHCHLPRLRYIGFTGRLNCEMAVSPQLFPPPSYEVPALLLFKDGFSFGWKTLPPHRGAKMNAIFHPTQTFAAAKESARVFFELSYYVVKAKIFGAPLHFPKIHSPRPHDHAHDDKKALGDSSVAKSNELPFSWSSATNQSIQDLLKAMQDGPSAAKRHSEMIENVPFSYPIQAAAKVFKQKQLQGLVRDQMNQARGSVQIKGRIYCFGTRGAYIVTVKAVYLPAEDRFLGPVVVTDGEISADFAARQKMLDWHKQNLKENGGHHVCPKDGVCPVHGKVAHKPGCKHHEVNSKHTDGAVAKPAAEETKPPASEPAPDKEK